MVLSVSSDAHRADFSWLIPYIPASGLKFVSLALRFSLDNPADELAVSFTRAWEEEYSKYFSWVVRPLFKVSVCDTRASELTSA